MTTNPRPRHCNLCSQLAELTPVMIAAEDRAITWKVCHACLPWAHRQSEQPITVSIRDY